MAKTHEELNELKKEYTSLATKLQELSDEELIEVTGGDFYEVLKKIGEGIRSTAGQVLNISATVSPEEELGGKIHVIPVCNDNKK